MRVVNEVRAVRLRALTLKVVGLVDLPLFLASDHPARRWARFGRCRIRILNVLHDEGHDLALCADAVFDDELDLLAEIDVGGDGFARLVRATEEVSRVVAGALLVRARRAETLGKHA